MECTLDPGVDATEKTQAASAGTRLTIDRNFNRESLADLARLRHDASVISGMYTREQRRNFAKLTRNGRTEDALWSALVAMQHREHHDVKHIQAMGGLLHVGVQGALA